MNIYLGIGIGVGIVVLAFAYLAMDHSPVAHWKSSDGKQKYETAYMLAMKRLPKTTGSYDVATQFGTVRVYEWGNAQNDRTPVVLIPGRSSGVPMWYATIPDLAAAHHVYAIDFLGDSGKSVQTAKISNVDDQNAWLDQMFDGLGLQKINLVGYSFGGLAAAHYAAAHQDRISSLSLIEPIMVFAPLKPSAFFYAMLATLPLPNVWRQGLMNKIGVGATNASTKSDPVARMIYDGTTYFAAKVSAPPQITNDQLRSWNMPVFGALAENTLHDSQAALQTARTTVKKIDIQIWPKSTHALPMEYSTQINQSLTAFLMANN